MSIGHLGNRALENLVEDLFGSLSDIKRFLWFSWSDLWDEGLEKALETYFFQGQVFF